MRTSAKRGAAAATVARSGGAGGGGRRGELSDERRRRRRNGRGDGSRSGDDGRIGGWSTPREWARLWLYAFGAYTVFVILSGWDNVAYSMTHGGRIDWSYILRYRVLEEYTCALFVPLFFWLVHRYPIDRAQWRRSVPILFAATIVAVVVKYAIFRPLAQLVLGRAESFVAAVAQNGGVVLIDFWGVIGVAQAIEFYRRAQERERIAARLRAELTQAQLEALRSQLHPHFLFNTLNGVATLMHRDVEAADRMVTNLADLLRATLQRPAAHEIPLRDELALVERYLAIVAVRFGDRLTARFDIAPDVGDGLVPQFLLQPLVENALEHGIAERPGPGRIEIRAVQAGDTLRITVTDDGAGLRPDGAPRHGVGLANTRARLAELYGTAQSLTLEPASADGGVRAVVTLPYRPRLAAASPLAAGNAPSAASSIRGPATGSQSTLARA